MRVARMAMVVATAAVLAQLSVPAGGQESDKAAQVARLKPQMKANAIAGSVLT